MDKYRIYRIHRNITIQKWRSNEWRTISYHGNSINSLISGLFDLIMAQHTPDKENISEALVGLQLDLVTGIEMVEKMIKEWCGDE
jgi:hypothetical protein